MYLSFLSKIFLLGHAGLRFFKGGIFRLYFTDNYSFRMKNVPSHCFIFAINCP